MGYTHYWQQKRDLTRDEWATLTEGAMALVTGCILHGIAICAEYDQPNDIATIDGDKIRFNGQGDDGHETFIIHWIERHKDKHRAPLPFSGEYEGYYKLVETWGHAYRKFGSFSPGSSRETCARKRLARVWQQFGANAEAPELFAPIRA